MRKLIPGLLLATAAAFAQTSSSICFLAASYNPPGTSSSVTLAPPKLLCVAPASLKQLLPQGPAGPTGPAGQPGPQGQPGPAGKGFTGGSCASVDGTVALFVQLPDQTCLPVIITGAGPGFVALATVSSPIYTASDGIIVPTQ